jgi:hypothetical protein
MADEKQQTSRANAKNVYARIPELENHWLEVAVAKAGTSKPKAIVEGIQLWLFGADTAIRQTLLDHWSKPPAAIVSLFADKLLGPHYDGSRSWASDTVSITVSKNAYDQLKKVDKEPTKAAEHVVDYYCMDRLKGLGPDASNDLESYEPAVENIVTVYACLPEILDVVFNVAVARARTSKPKAIIEAVLLWLHNRNEVTLTVSRSTYYDLNRQARIFAEKSPRIDVMLPDFLDEVVHFYTAETDETYVDRMQWAPDDFHFRPGVFPVSERPVSEDPKASEPEDQELPETTPLSAITLKTLKAVVKAAVAEAIAQFQPQSVSVPAAADPLDSPAPSTKTSRKN